LSEKYFLPGDLEAQIAAFINDYNHRRYHESIASAHSNGVQPLTRLRAEL